MKNYFVLILLFIASNSFAGSKIISGGWTSEGRVVSFAQSPRPGSCDLLIVNYENLPLTFFKLPNAGEVPMHVDGIEPPYNAYPEAVGISETVVFSETDLVVKFIVNRTGLKEIDFPIEKIGKDKYRFTEVGKRRYSELLNRDFSESLPVGINERVSEFRNILVDGLSEIPRFFDGVDHVKGMTRDEAVSNFDIFLKDLPQENQSLTKIVVDPIQIDGDIVIEVHPYRVDIFFPSETYEFKAIFEADTIQD